MQQINQGKIHCTMKEKKMKMVVSGGLQPPTYGLEDHCSMQLS